MNDTLATDRSSSPADAAPPPDEGPQLEDALRDPLTGLGNRRYFNRALEDVISDPAASDIALLMVDLDRFKYINDTLGHPTGDVLLSLVSRRLQNELRDSDVVARLGGDEFAVLLPRGNGAEILADRLVDIMGRPFLIEGHIANIGASVGIARRCEGCETASDMLRHADLALYSAKNAGRQTWRCFESSMAQAADARRSLEMDLRKAVRLNQFKLYYQPQFNVQTQKVNGLEALLRWFHPTRGLVQPDSFIPLAEEIGAIVAIGEWVLRTACREAAAWPGALRVAVNVSPHQLDDGDRLFAVVERALSVSGLSPNRLELEITESTLMKRNGKVLETLHRIRNLGVQIAMDDFGTGYSSLSQLRSFPFDKLKIDRSFVSSVADDSESAAVVRAIAALGTSLGMTVTAEGVETGQQATIVQADGCTDIQGYLVSRPIPGDQVLSLLQTYQEEANP